MNKEYNSLEAIVYKINDDYTNTKIGETKSTLNLSHSNSQPQAFRTLIKLKGEKYSWISEEPFVITTTTEIVNVKFEIDKTQEFNQYTAQHGHKGTVQSATQNNYIKVKFSMKNQKIRPEYTIARLFHPEYDLVTNSVKADYNKRDNSYYAIFDLGDPDTILPYSAKYTGKIFVADSILERSLLYTFGTFDIQFTQSRSGPP